MLRNKKAPATRIALAMVTATLTGTMATPAHAASVSAVGLLNLNHISGNPAAGSYSTGTTLGFGALIGTGMFPGFELEIGALYVPRRFNVDNAIGENVSTVNTKFLEIPVLLRFTALPIVSIGAGAYYARALGNITVALPGQAETSSDYSTQNLHENDFGLVAAAGAHFPILPTLSLVGDVRYLFGLTDLDSSGNSAKTRNLQLLVGISFGI